ncbi:MAG: hypothetical protein EBR40_03250 [Proteobacteria bacterium]|nr:hypothetical protein [Pseudomonadota bacterium]
MESVTVRSALEKAKLLVMSHGLMANMTPYSKSTLERKTFEEHDDSISFEFVLDPTKSSWDDDNFRMNLSVQYRTKGDVFIEGDRVRPSSRQIRFHWNSGSGTLEHLMRRESMMNNLLLLNELLVAALPEHVSWVVQTAAQIESEKKAEADKRTAYNIAAAIGKEAMRGLRTGGRSRTVFLTPAYLESFAPGEGKYPEDGTYTYEQIRRTDRRGRVKESVNYRFRVRQPVGYSTPAITVTRI